jgi:ATP-dependent Lon protease
MDNGARRALIPLENKRNFLEVSGDIVERVDPVFFSDPMTAAMKALGWRDPRWLHDKNNMAGGRYV